MRATSRLGILAGMATGFALAQAARRFSVRAGVSDDEAFGSLPGDEIIPHPMVEWTRGTTVHTSRERVWPWLAQMGYGRGGWYTPDWVDLIANRWVFGIKQPFPPSANKLLPEHEHVAAGDLICDGPDFASFFRVQLVDPPHAIVYRSIRHVRRGSPIGRADPAAADRVEWELVASGSYMDFTWALVVNEAGADSCRLLVRTRANLYPAAARVLVLPLGLFDATYGVAQLRAIARRAEITASVGAEAPAGHPSEMPGRHQRREHLRRQEPVPGDPIVQDPGRLDRQRAI